MPNDFVKIETNMGIMGITDAPVHRITFLKKPWRKEFVLRISQENLVELREELRKAEMAGAKLMGEKVIE